MDMKNILNNIKWQLIARAPGGSIYERVKGSIQNKDLTNDEFLYYIYWKELKKSHLSKYILGTYKTENEDYNEFYEWLDRFYKYGDSYEFKTANGTINLPVPNKEDYKCFKMEFLDLIMPYIKNSEGNEPFLEGPYEYNNVTVKRNSTVLDIGANYGMFSAFASSKGCSVHAFEPSKPAVNNYLKKTARLNSNITVVNECISNFSGRVAFNFNEEVPAASSIIMDDIDYEDLQYVQSNTIDNYVNTQNIRKVDFIKADIEGAERLMLMGAKETLKEYGPNLAICCYHLLDDIKVLRELILDANPDYEIEMAYKKIYAKVKKR